MSSAHEILDRLVCDLRDDLGAARATLRLDVPGSQPMPMTHEALASGVDSVQGRVVQAATAPTVAVIMRDRSPVVVDDTSRIGETEPLFDDDGFRGMVREYGGLASFVASPVFEDDRLIGILSLHNLGDARQWSHLDLERINEATETIGRLYRRYAREASVRCTG